MNAPAPPRRKLLPAATALFALMLAGCGATARAPTIVTFDRVPDASQRAAIERAAASDFADIRRIEGHEPGYVVGLADLNGDGRPDLLVRYADTAFCGSGGCEVFVVMAAAHGYVAKALPVQRYVFPGDDLVVLDSRHHGMRDLRYATGYVSRWNGKAYP